MEALLLPLSPVDMAQRKGLLMLLYRRVPPSAKIIPVAFPLIGVARARFLSVKAMPRVFIMVVLMAILVAPVVRLAMTGAIPSVGVLPVGRVKRLVGMTRRAILWQTLLQKAKLVPRGHMALPLWPLMETLSRPLLPRRLARLIWKAEQLFPRLVSPLLPRQMVVATVVLLSRKIVPLFVGTAGPVRVSAH